MNLSFRTTPRPEDIDRIRDIVISTKFFYDHEIEVAVELIEERLDEGEETGYHFVFAEADGLTVAYSCYGPIPMTKSSFDLYWIVTHSDYRGQGIGRKLLEETYRQVRAMGGTQLIAETSGLEQYTPTRSFYDSNHFTLAARLPDFYDRGDDKYIYIKKLD